MIPADSGKQECKRHAALVLHAVSAADRSWLLEHLPRSAREELDPLLHELAALGIPSDPSFISRVVRPSAIPADANAVLLRPENAPRVADILRGEPERVAARVASYASGDRYPTCPPRLANAILTQVRLRLIAQMAEPAQARRTWTSRVMGAFRSRTA